MSCNACIEELLGLTGCEERLTLGSGSGAVEGSGGEILYQKLICAEDPLGRSLYLKSLRLADFIPCEGEDLPGISEGSGSGAGSGYPLWLTSSPEEGISPAPTGGTLITPGSLYRLCVLVQVDAQAAFEEFGEGLYEIELIAERNDGTGGEITCNWWICIEQGTVPIVIDVTPNVIFGGGAWDSTERIVRFGMDGSGSIIIVDSDDFNLAFGHTESVQGIAFDNLTQKVFFIVGGAFTDVIYRCNIDGSGLEEWYDFNDGNDSDYIYSPPEGGYLWVGRETADVFRIATDVAPSPEFIGELDSVNRDISSITSSPDGSVFIGMTGVSPNRIAKWDPALETPWTQDWLEIANNDGCKCLTFDRVNNLLLLFDPFNTGTYPIGWRTYDPNTGALIEEIDVVTPSPATGNVDGILEIVSPGLQRMFVVGTNQNINGSDYPSGDNQNIVYNGSGSTGGIFKLASGRLPI